MDRITNEPVRVPPYVSPAARDLITKVRLGSSSMENDTNAALLMEFPTFYNRFCESAQKTASSCQKSRPTAGFRLSRRASVRLVARFEPMDACVLLPWRPLAAVDGTLPKPTVVVLVEVVRVQGRSWP